MGNYKKDIKITDLVKLIGRKDFNKLNDEELLIIFNDKQIDNLLMTIGYRSVTPNINIKIINGEFVDEIDSVTIEVVIYHWRLVTDREKKFERIINDENIKSI
jgi:hypothetical protein